MWRVVTSDGDSTLEFRFADVTNNQHEGIPFPQRLLKKIIALSKVEQHYQLYFGLTEIVKGGTYELDRRDRRRAKSAEKYDVSNFILLFTSPMEKLTQFSGIAILLRSIEVGFEMVGVWISDFTKAYGPESTDLIFSILRNAISEPSLFLHVYLYFPSLKRSTQ